MGWFRSFQRRRGWELAVVVVPLLAILGLQYVASRRLAEVEVIVHQATISQYLNVVAGDVRRLYEEAAQRLLDVPGDVLAEKRFEEIERHFEGTDTSVARLLFAGSLEGCWCLAEYYDPATRRMGVADEVGSHVGAAEGVVLRISAMLQASTLPRPKELRLHLDRKKIYVDEENPDTRVVYRFITGAGGSFVGFVGFIIDAERFEREFLPQAMAGAAEVLDDDVSGTLMVRVADQTGRLVAGSHVGPEWADALSTHFDFVFRDWRISGGSLHVGAARVLDAEAFIGWMLTVLMSITVLAGVLLTSRAADRARRLSRIRNAFVANVSHELRTPLTSLAAFGELLRRGCVTSPEKTVEYGRHIEHESNRLRQLIDNVLNFARIESATVHYRREEASIEDVVRAAIYAVDPRRQRDGFVISVTCPESLLPAVRIDVEAMTGVFVNLLDNAMKYSGSSRRVHVTLAQRGDCVAVVVADFGIGIAPDDQERIFHQFFRARRADETGVTGTGLGLAIVRHVVDAHHGRIEVDSGLGRGSAFTLLIPVADSVAPRYADAVHTHIDRAGMEAGAGA